MENRKGGGVAHGCKWSASTWIDASRPSYVIQTRRSTRLRLTHANGRTELDADVYHSWMMAMDKSLEGFDYQFDSQVSELRSWEEKMLRRRDAASLRQLAPSVGLRALYGRRTTYVEMKFYTSENAQKTIHVIGFRVAAPASAESKMVPNDSTVMPKLERRPPPSPLRESSEVMLHTRSRKKGRGREEGAGRSGVQRRSRIGRRRTRPWEIRVQGHVLD
ncbi:hypothetical protein CPB85DRAFT_1257412 [Mucidula mucida]|nr:hypothetical protein CPB85DRAFT_1257412 [Mucidula mucida]